MSRRGTNPYNDLSRKRYVPPSMHLRNNSLPTRSIIVITSTGFAARVISKYRPALPILAFSESLRTVRELALCWGVRAQYLPKLAGNDVETEALCAVEHAMATGYLTSKDKHVCVLIPSADPSAGFFSGIYDVSRLASKGFKL
jgi:pyruvate kinase